MKILRAFSVTGLLISFFALAPLSCGGGGGPATLIITPAGPVEVQKGQTLLFSSNIVGTTWSVEGGDANGTISSTGLYTPPATFPATPEAVVKGTGPGGEEGNAQVLLRTANQIVFDPATRKQINQTPIASSAVGIVFSFGSSNNFDVRQGSLKASAVWLTLDDKGTPADDSDDEAVGYYSEEVDFLGFSPQRELFRGLTQTALKAGGAVLLDEALNPSFVSIEINNSATDFAQDVFYHSPDGGATFPNPVPISPTTAEVQAFPDMVQDPSGAFHVIFTRLVNNDPDPNQSGLLYARSANGGVNWEVKDLTPLSADPLDFSSSLAVSSEGTLAVCWIRIADPSGTPSVSLQLTVSQDGGNNFSTPINFGIDAPNSSSPALCDVSFGPDGKIYVTYPDGGNVGLARSDDNGVSFAFHKTINPDPTHMTTPFIRSDVDGLGRIDVVWLVDQDQDVDGIPEVLAFARSTDSGENFTTVPSIPLDIPNIHTAVTSGLRHDASGRLFVGFYANQNDPDDPFNLYLFHAE